jgi:uncharacterized protein YcnI
VTRRAGIVAVLGAAAVFVLTASTASAHVTVNPKEAPAGATVTLTFRVPNERDARATVGVEISLPTEGAFGSVEPKAKAGWTQTAEPTKVTWSGGRIDPDRSEDFQLVAGPLPSTTEQLVFKVLQTYEGGEVVRWIEVPQSGAPEPDHPAAVLKIVGGAATTSSSSGAPAVSVTSTTVGPIVPDDDSFPTGIVVGAVVVAALAAGGVVLARRRRD